MSGLTLGNADTPLTQRAADYLAAGPADPQALIAHVCQIPSTPRGVAEHMAAALFAVSLAGLFGTSATYHTGNWAPHVRDRLRR